MAHQPLLTVVVPTWNRQDEVIRNLESLKPLLANPKEYEIIITDNNSSDSTVSNVRDWAECNKANLKLFVNEKNIGPLNNWKNGVDKANGLYIHLLFSDDLVVFKPGFTSKRLERCLSYAHENNISLLRLLFSVTDEHLKPSRDRSIRWKSLAVAESSFGRTEVSSQSFLAGHIFPKTFLPDESREAYSPVSPTCYIIKKTSIMQTLNKYSHIKQFSRTGAGVDQLCILRAAYESSRILEFHDIEALMVASSTSITFNSKSRAARNSLFRSYNLSAILFSLLLFRSNKIFALKILLISCIRYGKVLL